MVKVVSIEVPEGLDEKDVRLAIAIEAFRRGLISVGKAAELAGIPLQTFIEELKKRGIEVPEELSLEKFVYTPENVKKAVEYASKVAFEDIEDFYVWGSPESCIEKLEKWVKEADESIGARVPMIVVGNKIDLPDRMVSPEEAKQWAEERGFLYMESSAKTGEGVADMFTVLAELMWREARGNTK